MNGMDDMGGNPLQEGVWANIDGGWQNRMKRDESFASVRTSSTVPVTIEHPMGFHNDPADGVEQMAASLEKAGKGTLLLNGIPYQQAIPQLLGSPQGTTIEVTHDHPKGLAMISQMIQEGNANAWRAMKAKQKAKQQAMPQQPQQPMASVTAALDIDWDDDDDDLNPYQPPEVQERFFVSPKGHLLRPSQNLLQAKGSPNNIFHEEIGRENGLPDEEIMGKGAHALGQTLTDGSVELLHPGQLDPQVLQNQIARHFPDHQLDLGKYEDPLQPGNLYVEDRWGYPQKEDQGGHDYSDDYANESHPSGKKPTPRPSFGSRDKIYLPWSRETSSIEADFEVEQVVPPGPHTEEVDYGDSTPLILQHDDPQLLDNAKQKLEARVAGPEMLLPLIRAVGPSLLSGVVKGATGNSPGGATGGAPAPTPLPLEALSSIHNSLLSGFDGPFDNHPSSDANMTERADGDPDDVDPHEFNDSEDSLAKDDTGGGTDAFTPEVMSALEDAEPALIHYFNSEESGAHDPAISKLIEALERDHPGLLDQEPDPQALDALKNLRQASNPGQMGVPGIGGMTPPPGTQQLQSPVAQPQQQVNPMTQATCPHCGARLTAGQGVCPQCNGSVSLQPNTPVDPGMATQGIYPAGTPMTGQPGMGPFTAANQGPHNPEQFKAVKDYLIQNVQNPNELAQQLQDLIDHPENFGDILSEIQGKGQPPQPDPDPGAPPPPMPMGMPPGGGMPPGAPQGMPMQAAADAITPPCPKCNSHTTGLISDEGTAQCSNCNHKWKTDFEVQGDKTPVQPKASADHQRSDAWVDSAGAPLEVGKEYEMKTPKYDIPDKVTIESIKPEEIEYSLKGAYNLAHRTAISRDEAEMEGYSFEYVGADENDILNEQAPNDQMEAPSMAPAYSTVKTALGPYNNVGPIQPEEHALQSVNYPPSTQMQYETCPGCGTLTKPTLGGCPHCNTPMSGGVQPGGPVGDLDQWARENVPEDPHRYTAGKKFTPMEQREFIDEPGVARNSDKLDLENTHYNESDSLSEDLFLFGL